MDETVLVILLLTGFSVSSTVARATFFFINKWMTWDEAREYCTTEYKALASLHWLKQVTTMMETPTMGYTDKAWIGLHGSTCWTDGEPVTYTNWEDGQPDDDGFCVYMNKNGSWGDCSCTEMKPVACFDSYHYITYPGPAIYFIYTTPMTWKDALYFCKNQSYTLARVPDQESNDYMESLLTEVEEVWIGLKTVPQWFWSGNENKKYARFTNWQHGHPDNQIGEENCAATVVKTGAWTEELCNTTYPFFCKGVYKARKTVVRIKIQSRANMADPASSAHLKEQLYAAFNKQGLTDFKLSWKKLPVKQEQTSDLSSDAC